MIPKITITNHVNENQWLKRLNTQLNKPTKQNSIEDPKVTKPMIRIFIIKTNFPTLHAIKYTLHILEKIFSHSIYKLAVCLQILATLGICAILCSGNTANNIIYSFSGRIILCGCAPYFLVYGLDESRKIAKKPS